MGQPTKSEYIKAVNATDRSGGGCVGRDPLCYGWVVDVVGARDMKILDFGSGKHRTGHRILCEENGFEHVDSVEIGANVTGKHVKAPELFTYDIMIMSNVLNVQPSREWIISTIGNSVDYVKPGGVIIWNYPEAPRKTDLSASDVCDIMDIFVRRTTLLARNVYLSLC